MTGTRMTNNDKMRHLLAQRAKARATSHLRASYADEFDILVEEERDKTPEDSRSITYRRAERRLRKMHPHDFNVWYAVHQERLYREHGYVPASVHRRPPEIERASLALDILRKVATGEMNHRNLGECPEYPEHVTSRDPQCTVCQALNEVDFDAATRQAA